MGDVIAFPGRREQSPQPPLKTIEQIAAEREEAARAAIALLAGYTTRNGNVIRTRTSRTILASLEELQSINKAAQQLYLYYHELDETALTTREVTQTARHILALIQNIYHPSLSHAKLFFQGIVSRDDRRKAAIRATLTIVQGGGSMELPPEPDDTIV
ncbi:MAG: hypothetical protein Q4A34_03765 [Candidatus Saccharibacteria bacterium]|nr:hypothetical protein [Candidatus Saccharibacteria bacterium]